MIVVDPSCVETLTEGPLALAEVLDVPLITPDGRLARASGARCVIDLVG